MTIYRKSGSTNWYVEFQYCGQRIYRRTGTADRREPRLVLDNPGAPR